MFSLKHVVYLSFVSLTASQLYAQQAENYDIVVYSGTSAGITAGIQAAKLGKSVVIIEPTQFLGGLTTGGLGATDIGNKKAIGGLSREFYHRIWKHYNDPKAWTHEKREEYFSKKKTPNKADEETMWTFEPHVASKVYEDMLKAHPSVKVVYGERLDLQKGVNKDGAKITEIVMESGKKFSGKMFIDASYEGDLLAKGGASYHLGRESNSVYGETLNGVQTEHAVSHQFRVKVDPYKIPGDPKSGVIFGIQTDGPGDEFSGDKRIQAYNFRMCTTNVPENRLPWEKPADYDESMFELALRNVEAGDDRISWNPVMMPNHKTDTNNNFAVSTDFIGGNYDYIEADYATRDKIVKQHVSWQKGLMWTYAHHPRVPEKIRLAFQEWGLAKDEFLDNQNWPRQLYVREGRRLISDYVMTEKNCRRLEVVEDSVGMGAYNMDSHHTQRYITPEGYVRNEGDVQVRSRPYPISYRSIRPKENECTNLLVAVCLSSSHIAYGSIRMEPVFMVLGQSAATAASLAIDDKVSVQKVSYEKLKAQLLKDGQVLDFEVPEEVLPESVNARSLKGIVIDDSEAQLIGFQSYGSSKGPFVGPHYAHDGNEAKGDQRAIFRANLPKSGLYEVRVSYTALPNRAPNVPVTIKHAKGTTTVRVNQKIKANIDDLFLTVGTFEFIDSKPAEVVISNEETNGHVIVDAVQLIQP